MREFRDKVAVITGAASGVGRAVAERCVQEGMRVVLADVEEDALARAEATMSDTGATVLAVPTDVSAASDVEALARKTLEAFGAVHLVHNNAGVGVGGRIWENTVADWEWVMGVNMWGVIHGIRVFVPLMLEQDTEGHVVNTASVAGLVSGPGLGIYKVTKHGVVTLSETLHHELVQIGAKIGVSVLSPGFIRTQIMDSDRNRPASLGTVAQQGAEIVSGTLGVGSLLPVSTRGAVHDPCVHALEVVVPDAEPRGYARAKALDQHVGRGSQTQERRLSFGCLEIELHALHPASRAVAEVGRLDLGRAPARGGSDLDHLGAVVCEHARAARSRAHAREIEDGQAL